MIKKALNRKVGSGRPRPVSSAKTGASKRKSPSTSRTSKKAPVIQLQVANNQAIFANFQPYQLTGEEEYMSEAQVAHFKRMLITWKNKLLEDAGRQLVQLGTDSKDIPDEIDRASQEEQFAIRMRTRDRESRLVQKINEALFRIENDCFGFCDNCGDEIGLARMDARPTAELCIDCKNLEEIRERQGAVAG